jgi:signal transduction histidine kinase
MRFADFIKSLEDEKMNEIFSSSNDNGKNKTLDRILDITKRINRSLILDEVLQLVLKNAIEITHSDRGFILLKNSASELKFSIGLDAQDKSISESAFNISTSVVEEVFKTGLSRYIEGAQNDADHDQNKSIFLLDLQTILCAPLTTGDNKIGVIYLDSKALHRIQENEIISAFEIITGQAAIAIWNAQLFKQKIDANNELVRLNRELNEAKIIAEKSSMFKSSLLSNMSHEIRTPMNGILGLTSYLKDIVTENEHIKLLGKVVESAKRLMKTLSAMLDLSELESFNIKETTTYICVPVRIREIVKQYKNEIQEKKLDLKIQINSEFKVLFDDKYFTQLIECIVENAIKFTEKGTIKIICRSEEGEGIIQVADTGIGIEPDLREMIFDAFRQGSEGWNRMYEGIGLGLAIAKRITELYGGGISLESQPGKGSVFTITLPIIRD